MAGVLSSERAAALEAWLARRRADGGDHGAVLDVAVGEVAAIRWP